VVALLCAAVAAALPQVPTGGQKSSVTVRGSVLDSGRLPIPNATVTLASIDIPSVKITASTESSGDFTLTGLRPGFYIFEIRAGGFHGIQEGPVQIGSEKDTTLTPRHLTVDLKQAVCVLTVTSEPPAKQKRQRTKRK
jgi:hypothetical protein